MGELYVYTVRDDVHDRESGYVNAHAYDRGHAYDLLRWFHQVGILRGGDEHRPRLPLIDVESQPLNLNHYLALAE